MKLLLSFLLLSISAQSYELNADYFNVKDIFSASQISYETDGVEVFDRFSEDRKEEILKAFRNRCSKKIFPDHVNNLEVFQSANVDFNINDFQVIPSLSKTRNDELGFTTYKCITNLMMKPFSRYTVKPYYSKLFKGRKSEKKCEQFTTELLKQHSSDTLFGRRHMREFSYWDVPRKDPKLKVIKCQAMFLVIKLNPNYDPSPACDDNNQYSMELVARKMTLKELSEHQDYPYYLEGANALPLKGIGYFDGYDIKGSKKLIPYITNKQVHFTFDLPNISKIRGLVKIDSAALSVEANKGGKDYKTKTEILCSLDYKSCSGKLFHQRNWQHHINPNFFTRGVELENKVWSDLVSHDLNRVRELNFNFELDNLINPKVMFQDFMAGMARMDFVVADDVYMSPNIKMNITFNCKK